jgi:uncharacterized damage-inducible protein DinB
VFTVDGVRKFHGWTHASLSQVLDHLSTMPADDYVREVSGSGFAFPTLREQTIHIFNCEGFWLHTIQGLRYADRTIGECAGLADVRRLQTEVSQSTHAYLSTLTDEQLNADTELHFSDGDFAVRTPALIFHHVLTHAFHHKGQIVAMCRGLGYPAPDTHVIQFV